MQHHSDAVWKQSAVVERLAEAELERLTGRAMGRPREPRPPP